MRTVRTKIYQFNELTPIAKEMVIYNKIREKLTPNQIRLMSNSEWISACSEAKNEIAASQYEFTKEGNRFS